MSRERIDRRIRLVAIVSTLAFVAVSFPTLATPDRVLVVDDDDNDPDVRTFYTNVLDLLSIDYDVWDTGNSDVMEPDAATLSTYVAVIWFSGAAFTDPPPGVAGPGGAGEAALASFLAAGGCLLLSSQDYLFDHAEEGFTPFMIDHLGLGGSVDEAGYSEVAGAGPFTGVGPSVLSFPFENFSDLLTPNLTAEPAFLAVDLNPVMIAAISKTEGASRASFSGFPFEALPSEVRTQALTAFFESCGAFAIFTDDFESGDTSAWSQTVPTVNLEPD